MIARPADPRLFSRAAVPMTAARVAFARTLAQCRPTARHAASVYGERLSMRSREIFGLPVSAIVIPASKSTRPRPGHDASAALPPIVSIRVCLEATLQDRACRMID